MIYIYSPYVYIHMFDIYLEYLYYGLVCLNILVIVLVVMKIFIVMNHIGEAMGYAYGFHHHTGGAES